MIRDDLRTALRRALQAADPPETPDRAALAPARNHDHGDWASNVALVLRPIVGSPLEIAGRVKDALDAQEVPHLAKVEVAEPGFVNLFLAPTWLLDVLRAVVDAGEAYGRVGFRSATRSRTCSPRKVQKYTGSTTSTTRETNSICSRRCTRGTKASRCPKLTQPRLVPTEACRIGLANALALLGVNAPDERARLDHDDV